MKIITWQLAEKLPRNHRLLINHTVNPQQDDSNLYSILTDNEKLTIYDATTTQEHLQNTIIGVNNHINRTGTNPLIGKQKKFGINFIDITNLYKNKKENVITNCCGKNLNTLYPYPSHYLCNISILARALGTQKISAFLVNIL